MLRSVVDVKEEVAIAGSSVLDGEIPKELGGDDVGVVGVAVGDGGNPVDLGASGDS